MKSQKSQYNKYELYEASVQAADDDSKFLARIYKKERSKDAISLREDFCGTYWLCAEWVKSHSRRTSVGVDISSVPVNYGNKTHMSLLRADQKKRLSILNQDVRTVSKKKFDLICALNFSYFIFKTRDSLRDYFRSVKQSLGKEGIFLIDHFGGPLNMNPQVESRSCVTKNGKAFKYQWEQATFNPITNEAKFYIHFSTPDKLRIEKAFTYDWRMWTIPEIREIMLEAGFSKTKVYWEYNSEDFKPSEVGEDDCDVWICYILGII